VNGTHALQVALAKAKLPRLRFHDLRHAYATLMLEAEELAMVSSSLGYANLSTTADVYGHVTVAMQERSAARMDVILAGSGVRTGVNPENQVTP
jgi:integrase